MPKVYIDGDVMSEIPVGYLLSAVKIWGYTGE